MNIGAAALRGLYKLAGVKKMFAMPEEKLLKEIEKQNKHRGFFMPTDHKAFYPEARDQRLPVPNCTGAAQTGKARDSILFWRRHGDRPGCRL